MNTAQNTESFEVVVRNPTTDYTVVHTFNNGFDATLLAYKVYNLGFSAVVWEAGNFEAVLDLSRKSA